MLRAHTEQRTRREKCYLTTKTSCICLYCKQIIANFAKVKPKKITSWQQEAKTPRGGSKIKASTPASRRNNGLTQAERTEIRELIKAVDVIHRNANGEIYTRQLDMRRDELDGETRAAVDVMLRYGARSTDHAKDKISTIKDDAKERVKAAQRQARREAMKRKNER